MLSFDPGRLRAARQAAGLSREALAVAVGGSYSSVTRWETGRCAPCGDVLGQLADALSCNIGDLFTDERTAPHADRAG
jgi:transcriptional regulator with XRE-family HTH domain